MWLRLPAQIILTEPLHTKGLDLFSHALIADAGSSAFNIDEVIDNKVGLSFRALTGPNENLGFTSNNYWVKFTIVNNTGEQADYYLETGRPVTDFADLYAVNNDGEISEQHNGDALDFNKRSFNNRKCIFKIKLKDRESATYYLHLKSDGEVINLPLRLYAPDTFMAEMYLEQIVFGFFYGILLLACITYLFFYFALRERSFLYYSLYVFFIFLLQFALDGFIHQYVLTSGSGLALKSVVLFAACGSVFLGKYAESFLGVRKYFKLTTPVFNLLYLSQFIIIGWVLIASDVPAISYPLANLSGLLVLSLLLLSIAGLYLKKVRVDPFFATGIGFLVLGFVIFILNNFSLIPNSFITANSSKLGTGMEVIFLSLSMANRIRILKKEKEEMQSLALKKSEDMNELKSYFMSNMSHELRTPLNAIMGITDMMLKENLEERLIRQFEMIKYSSVGLLSCVNDIFDFGKIEKGELQLEMMRFEPLEILGQIKSNACKQANDKGLEFIYETDGELPSCLMGDPARLGQIVNNVLSNAVKFTPTGWVKFSIGATTPDNGITNLLLTISDSGVGIPKEKLNDVFEAFMQESISNKRKFGGLGLGLSIVKKLVDLHLGSIRLQSEPGKGTVCNIIIPYTVAEPEQQVSLFADFPYNLKGNRILVVEDNTVNQLLLKTILRKWEETDFDIAADGEEALFMMNKKKYDLVLMDLQMPVMDGYETTFAIRGGGAGENHVHIPIIAVTADTTEGTRYKVKEIGMDDYLTKPINQQVLYHTITKVLSAIRSKKSHNLISAA